jgi:hypothetical protein
MRDRLRGNTTDVSRLSGMTGRRKAGLGRESVRMASRATVPDERRTAVSRHPKMGFGICPDLFVI